MDFAVGSESEYPGSRPHASSAFLLSLDTSSDPLSTMNNLDKIVIGFNAPYAVMNTLAPKQCAVAPPRDRVEV